MDVREKLVELLLQEDNVCEPSDCKYCGVKGSCGYYRTADRLIANGVTVQEWVSVNDGLPEVSGFPCLLCGKNSFGEIRVFEGFTGYMERGKFEWHSNQKDIDIDVWTITHWMPLPQPPKGE